MFSQKTSPKYSVTHLEDTSDKDIKLHPRPRLRYDQEYS
jgi:hypothetical protein